MAWFLHFVSKPLSPDFVLYFCRSFFRFDRDDRVDDFVLHLVAAAATDALCGRTKQFYMFGLSDYHQKLGGAFGDFRDCEQRGFVYQI